jgi:hypothetical protein
MSTLKVNELLPTSGDIITLKGELLVEGKDGNIIIGGTGSSDLSASYAATAGCASNINISTIVPGDTTTSVVLVNDQAVGCQSPFIDSGLTYNAATNILNATVTTAQTAQTASYVNGSNVNGIVALASHANSATDAENADFAISSSYAAQALSSSYAVTASYVKNAQTASYVAASNVVGTVANAATASYVTASNIVGTVANAATASYVNLTAGPGIQINDLKISSSIVTVNGVFPTNGNVATTLTQVKTGTSASLIVSSSGAITSSLPDGLVWIVSNDPTSSNNGDAYIFHSSSVGAWYPISPLDVPAADARYLKLDGNNSPMSGDLNMGGNDLINVGIMYGTASWAFNAITASYVAASNVVGTVANAITASYAISASYEINYEASSSYADFAVSSSHAVTSNIVQETVYDNFLPSGSNISSSAYLNWGINLIPSASGMLDFACHLPNPPIKGRSVSVINTCGIDVHVYPSVAGGSIEGEIDGFAIVPSDGKSYTFTCYENPLPGAWVVSNPVPIIGYYDTNNVNFGNFVWRNHSPYEHNVPSAVNFYFIANQNYPYPITTPIQSALTSSGIGMWTQKSWANGVPYYLAGGQRNPSLPQSSYTIPKWYTVGGFGGGGGLVGNNLYRAPWDTQSLAVEILPAQYINNNFSVSTCEQAWFSPPPGQPQFDSQYILNTQLGGGSLIKPSAGRWRRIKKITITSNISSSFYANAVTEGDWDVYTPGSNPYFVASNWQAGSPNPNTDFFYAPELIPLLTSPNIYGPAWADPAISYYSYQKPGTFTPSAGTYTTSTVGGPGTRIVEITYPENARIQVSDFIGAIKVARKNTNLISNNAQLIAAYPKVDYWLTRALAINIQLTPQDIVIPVGSTLNNISFRIRIEYQQ